MKAKLVRRHTENLAKNIISFWFEPEKPLDHIAGQYVEMTLRHDKPDERGQKRWFTLSSSPTDAPLFSITTKFASEHGSSFKQALHKLKLGDDVLVSEPMGDFVLPIDGQIPLVFVAGGIGITPFHSIIKWLHDTRQEREITFLYGVNDEHEIVFQDLFEHYGLDRTIVVNKPLGTWDGETGQLTGQRILDVAQPTIDALLYVSGPEAMTEALDKQLQQLGIKQSRLVGDFFPGYTKL
jgi:glycine betaine catabolism B